jgi:hypothetical protein
MPSHSEAGQGFLQGTGSETAQRHELVAHPNLMTRIPRSLVDPLLNFPGRLSGQGREAVDYCELR